MKKSKKITLLVTPMLSALLLTGCGGGGEEETRDVYQSMEDCLADWGGTPELCSRMDDDDERHYHSSHGVGYPVFWGPRYYPSDRSVIYRGREITPSLRRTTLAPATFRSGSSGWSRPSVSSPRSSSVSSGGFGGRGGSVGG